MPIDQPPDWTRFDPAFDLNTTVFLAPMQGGRNITFTGPGGKNMVTIDFDGDRPTVKLAPGVTWDEAGKVFWNVAARLVGQRPLFPEGR